ncbi:hypothetical protein CYLTODRAFT_459689 [Cylindrobasidium torrendii FP15055 ss-10]|uniref:Uncharacterized protein n=1 Tax=Cylindrobasidium torrendii FP15055 ss-10 TaxID=1314674 RepID=A0A0D7AWG6_9AGAR|nr:hypothetical protein CYLTODRAFT_459689 [Cylindrobasidium torrendii FP15055 ss-10]
MDGNYNPFALRPVYAGVSDTDDVQVQRQSPAEIARHQQQPALSQGGADNTFYPVNHAGHSAAGQYHHNQGMQSNAPWPPQIPLPRPSGVYVDTTETIWPTNGFPAPGNWTNKAYTGAYQAWWDQPERSMPGSGATQALDERRALTQWFIPSGDAEADPNRQVDRHSGGAQDPSSPTAPSGLTPPAGRVSPNNEEVPSHLPSRTPSPTNVVPSATNTSARSNELRREEPAFVWNASRMALGQEIQVAQQLASGREPESHAARNPFLELIPLSDRDRPKRSRKTNAQLGDAALKQNGRHAGSKKAMLEAVEEVFNAFDTAVNEAARKTNRSAEHIKAITFGAVTKKGREKSAYNAYNSFAKSVLRELEDPEYERLSKIERSKYVCRVGKTIRQMATGKGDLSPDEMVDLDWESVGPLPDEKAVLDLLQDKRDQELHGVRANNKGAAADAFFTGQRIESELDHLHTRTGYRGLLLLAPGHESDYGIPQASFTGGMDQWFEKEFDVPGNTALARFETASKLEGTRKKTSSSPSEMYTEIRQILLRGARSLSSGSRSIDMIKWDDHDAMRVDYGVELTGWPDLVPFICPSKLWVQQLRFLHEEVVHGRVRFQKVSAEQRRTLIAARALEASNKKSSKAQEKRSRPAQSSDANDGERPAKKPRKAANARQATGSGKGRGKAAAGKGKSAAPKKAAKK